MKHVRIGTHHAHIIVIFIVFSWQSSRQRVLWTTIFVNICSQPTEFSDFFLKERSFMFECLTENDYFMNA